MLRIDRRLIKNFDWITLALILLIALIGVMTIYSATRPLGEGGQPRFYIKQILCLIIGIIALLGVISFDYVWLGRFSLFLYITGVILLVAVLLFGKTGLGAQRWLSLGPLSFQPSEFFKLSYIIMLSYHLSTMQRTLNIPALLRIFFMIVLLPFIILVKQPDLGMALVIFILFVLLSLGKGLQKKAVILFLVISLISLPFLGNIVWEGLRDYQKSRLVAFLEPGVDPAGIGYQISQSKIAVGSGKVLGKGYLKGTQGPFRFLPEKHTDFIFSVFAEEWGFFGSLVLASLYLLIILRGLDTARNARDEFGRLLALGVIFMFSTYFFINVGMTMGIMPVVGIPLPFMSYGGTALLSNMVAAGILMNIRTRRFYLF